MFWSGRRRFRRERCEGPKGSGFFVVEGYGTGSYVIDPAVQREVSVLDAVGYGRVGPKVFQLCDHVVFCQFEQINLRVLHFGVTEPVGYVGIGLERIGIERALHDTAVGMSANDDLRDAQHSGRVFHGGGNASDGIRIRRNYVADHATDKELAGFGLSEQAGVDARIGTGDEEGIGALAHREFLEQVEVLRIDVLLEPGNALEEFVDGHGFALQFSGLVK